MLASHYENIFHLHFLMNQDSGTIHRDHIAEKENYCFLFHARTNKNIQNHSLSEKRRCDESHLTKTYQRE